MFIIQSKIVKTIYLMNEQNKKLENQFISSQVLNNLNRQVSSNHRQEDYNHQQIQKGDIKVIDQEKPFNLQKQIENKMVIYFNKITSKKRQNISISEHYEKLVNGTVEQNIKSGILSISQNKQSVSLLLRQQKLRNQQQKLYQNKAYLRIKQNQRKNLSPFYQKMQQKLSSSTDQDIKEQYLSKIILSKDNHQKLVRKFIHSNKRNQTQRRRRLEMQQQAEKSFSHDKYLQLQIQRKQEIQRKRKILDQKLRDQKDQHQKFLIQQRQSIQKYKEIKRRKFLYKQLDEKYKTQNQILTLEAKKNKIKQIRQFHKKYDSEELKKHQLQYLQKRSQDKANIKPKSQIFKYNPPQKTKRLAQLLLEQKLSAKLKIQQQNRLKQQNKIRMMNFLQEVENKFKPKIDEKKKQQIETRFKTQQSLSAPKISINLKKIGTQYFQESKRRMKTKSSGQKTQGHEENEVTNVGKTTLLLSNSNQFNKYYQQLPLNKRYTVVKASLSPSGLSISQRKRKQLHKLINADNVLRQQKLEKLRIQNQRIDTIYKLREKHFSLYSNDRGIRQQAIDILLDSIGTKIGILSVSKHQ